VRRHRNLIILIVMAALVAVSLYYIIPPSEKTRLGLDLQGGLEVVYTARTADGKPPTKAQLEQTTTKVNQLRANLPGTVVLAAHDPTAAAELAKTMGS
jgi:preprotein translocase subunit SecD